MQLSSDKGVIFLGIFKGGNFPLVIFKNFWGTFGNCHFIQHLAEFRFLGLVVPVSDVLNRINTVLLSKKHWTLFVSSQQDIYFCSGKNVEDKMLPTRNIIVKTKCDAVQEQIPAETLICSSLS